MRATMSGYYRNLNYDQNKVAKELFDVTKQISSGVKIQYGHEDISTFVDTVRLDNELTTLMQAKNNAQKALQVSTNTDSTMTEMTKLLDAMKVKFIAASGATNSTESLKALAAELRGLETNLIQLANTSVDGKYLFSGSQIKTLPIDTNGVYQGNDKDLQAFLGSGVSQTYNINGADLFLGDENDTHRKISLNIPLYDQKALYPDIMIDSAIPRSTAKEEHITSSSTIRDLMGDNDNIINTVDAQHHFYIQGTNHEGTSFKQVVSMRDDENVNDLLSRIGDLFGNSSFSELVTVSLNKVGQIEIEDKRAGSSKLDFHMVANTDLTGAVADTQVLNTNRTNVKSFMKSDYTQFLSTIGQRESIYNSNSITLSGDFLTIDKQNAEASTLLSKVLRSDVASIRLSGVDSAGGAVGTVYNVTATSTMQNLMDAIEASYDVSNVMNVTLQDGKIRIEREDGSAQNLDIVLRTRNLAGTQVEGIPSDASVAFDESEFIKEGNKLLSNVSQIVKSDNAYANLSTKLVDVAGVVSLNNENLVIEGINTAGQAFDVQINLLSAGSTFTVTAPVANAGTYAIFDTSTPRAAVDADGMTYRQLTDVISMVTTGTFPLGATAAEYDTAVDSASKLSNTTLSFDGKIEFTELNKTNTLASFSLSDANASNFATNASVLSFQSNNALAISDAKTDFFAQIDAAISSVETYKARADGTLDDPRNLGMQNAIQALDDLSIHLFNQHSKAGVQSQTLRTTEDRTDLLIITTRTLRSETLDIDIAEASLELQQLTLNYQAMLSTVTRITQLSLVNYL